ncbi:hypothetical protein ACOSP7_032551 [Xanthoceras sorbifolium]
MIRGNTGEWSSWLLANLMNKNLINGYPMCIYFIFTIWFIWKLLHPWPHIPIFGAVQDWLVAAGKRAKFDKGFANRFVSWCPPPPSWMKLNVDGSRSGPTGCIAAAGVIRDSNGQWLGGFTLNKGIGSALEVELWGMVEGLLYAWQAGYKFVIIETDCNIIVELLGQDIKECHPLFNLLHNCKSLIHGDWFCKVVHIYREANKLADWMAKLGLQSDLGVKYLEEPPMGCLEIIKDDAT